MIKISSAPAVDDSVRPPLFRVGGPERHESWARRQGVILGFGLRIAGTSSFPKNRYIYIERKNSVGHLSLLIDKFYNFPMDNDTSKKNMFSL